MSKQSAVRDEKRRVLEEVGVYVSTPLGKSMRPMLRGGRDNILVEKPTGRLKKYDVALYKRGSAYVATTATTPSTGSPTRTLSA